MNSHHEACDCYGRGAKGGCVVLHIPEKIFNFNVLHIPEKIIFVLHMMMTTMTMMSMKTMETMMTIIVIKAKEFKIVKETKRRDGF